MLYVFLLTINKIYFYIDIIQSCIMSYIYIYIYIYILFISHNILIKLLIMNIAAIMRLSSYFYIFLSK